jgi:hypothetical protein
MHENQQTDTHYQDNDGNPELNVSKNAPPYSGLASVLTIHDIPCYVSK